MAESCPYPLEPETAQRLAEIFRALADPTRLRLIAEMMHHGRVTVHQLANAVGVSISAVSHQLRTLRQLRLVRAQRMGRHVWYSLDDEHVAALYCMGLDHVLHG